MDKRQQISNGARRAAFCGLFVALALVLSWIEFIFPLQIPLPGVKLGLANLVTVFALYKLKPADTVAISLARIVLAGLLFGGLFSMLYALCGGILSLVVMMLLKKTGRLAVVTVSICGGVAHNLGQLAFAFAAMNSEVVAAYLPALLAGGIVSGAVIGALGGILAAKVDVRR